MGHKNTITTSDYLPYDEYDRLLNCFRNDEEYFWELYARVSFCTACRVSDVLSLRWNQILNKSQETIVEKKTGKTRVLYFNSSVQAKFKELWKLMGSPEVEDYIFTTSWSKGSPTTSQNVNRKLKEFKRRYKIKIGNFSTHTFRKTFGRYVYEKNNKSAESLVLLNKIFNHHSIQVTKTYIGITQDEINNIFNSIQF